MTVSCPNTLSVGKTALILTAKDLCLRLSHILSHFRSTKMTRNRSCNCPNHYGPNRNDGRAFDICPYSRYRLCNDCIFHPGALCLIPVPISQACPLSSPPAWLWEPVAWPRKMPLSGVCPLWRLWAALQSSALTRLAPSPPIRCV